MENIKSIAIYDEVYELAFENIEHFDEGITEDMKDFLVHMNDFESTRFCLINYEAVLVYEETCGDVIARYDSVEDFVNSCMEEYEE